MAGLLQSLLVCIALFGSLYLAFARRRFDLPAMAFFGACFYFVPGLVGFVGYAEGLVVTPVRPEIETYLVMCTVLVALLAAAVLNQRWYVGLMARHVASDRLLGPAAVAATTLGMIGFVLTVITLGDQLFSRDKASLLGVLNRWHLVWTGAAVIGMTLAWLAGSRWQMLIHALLLVINLYVGFRVDAVIALLAVVLCWMMLRERGRMAAQWRLGLLIMFAGLAMFVLKYLLVAIQLQDTELLRSQLRNPEAVRLIFLYSEPFIAQGTLNEVIRQQYWVGPGHLADSLYLIVPFASELGASATGFNALFQPTLFSSVEQYGLGNNIWAEMLASGGWPLLLTFVVLYVAMLVVSDRVMRQLPPVLFGPTAVVMTYWAFYVHRNDLLYQLTLTRRILLLSMAVVALGALFLAIQRSVASLMISSARRPKGKHA